MKFSRLAILTFFIGGTLCPLLSHADHHKGDDGEVLKEKKKPNIVFIIIDDQQRDEFAYTGGKVLTPNQDMLAAEGAYFENFTAASTVCTPSRYSCVTGRYCSRNQSKSFKKDISSEGIAKVYFNTHVESDRPNIPNVLQKNGYRTGFVGKWHIGFERHKKIEIEKGSDPKDPKTIAKLKEYQASLVEGMKTFGFDYASRVYAGNALDSKQLKNAGVTMHNIEWLTEGALEFIESSKDEPFYLYYSTTLPHSPSPLESMKADPRLSPIGLLEKAPRVQPSREEVFKRVKDAGLSEDAASASWLDDSIGAILKKLEDLKILDNTMIVFFNDHGMEHSSKSSLYQGAMKTASMTYWKGKIKPQVSEILAQNVDFAATILDVAGVTPPVEMELDGDSYFPNITEGKSEFRESAYGEIGYTRSVQTHKWKYLAFRVPGSIVPSTEEGLREQEEYLNKVKEKHKWVKWEPVPNAPISHTGGAPGGDFLNRLIFQAKPPYLENYYDADQLYDIEKDPLETTNLAEDPKYAGELAKMKSLLKGYLDKLPGTFADLKE